MQSILLAVIEHRGKQCVAIRGRLTQQADALIREFPGRQFSKTHSCWYVEHETEVVRKLHELLSAVQYVELSPELADAGDRAAVLIELPDGYHECLVRVRYSQATAYNYESQMRAFISWLHPRKLDAISTDVIHAYLVYLVSVRKVSVSTQNTAINAIKFYLEKVHRGERKVYYVDRPIKEVKLPRVLSQEEVRRMIEVIRNPKHRCMLLLLYSAGLRMSELLNLRWRDFDTDRMQLFVDGGKGKKDRMTLLSGMVVEYVKYYLSLYKPVDFLFEGPGHQRYSPRSVNMIVHRAAKMAGIQKDVSAHTLRHSFATHLLEQSIDIRYIQVLMGHESSKTTERYTHVTTRGFSKIKSPLDGLGISLGAEDGPQNKNV
jgi:site-specific recombinase XerD